MTAKTYDEDKKFDMQKKWHNFLDKKLNSIKYGTISSSTILSLLSVIISDTKECTRKVILSLEKEQLIEKWDTVISSLEDAIEYFNSVFLIPASNLLPYDSLLVPFSYFFYKQKDGPNGKQQRLLKEFFWRMSLSYRYSSATESKLAQDIKRIDKILNDESPIYTDIKVALDSPQTLIETNFSTGNSYCKAVLCLLASYEPKNFNNHGKVRLDNDWLKMAHSKNFHHFFPKAYLKKNKAPYSENSSSIVNITFVSDQLNKRKIRDRAPSDYIHEFEKENKHINDSLATHLISTNGFGIHNDNYEEFLNARAQKIFDELQLGLKGE